MTRKIAFFEAEQQAINAIQQLEQAGFVSGELQVLAKDGEHTKRIETESDMHVDELQALTDARSRPDVSPDFIAPDSAAVFGFGGGFWANSFNLPAVFGATFTNGGDEEDVLKAFDLDDKEIQACLEALRNGSIAVVVETDESKSLLDKDGGPDLSRLGIAEGVFRACGANSIISGS